MKPVYQTDFGAATGNCFAACVASILELELEDVPFFMDLGDTWFDGFTNWLSDFGLLPLCINAQPNMEMYLPLCLYIVGGKTPRGHMHAAVYFNGDLVHDPLPGGMGITEVTDYIVFVKNFHDSSPKHPVAVKWLEAQNASGQSKDIIRGEHK